MTASPLGHPKRLQLQLKTTEGLDLWVGAFLYSVASWSDGRTAVAASFLREGGGASSGPCRDALAAASSSLRRRGDYGTSGPWLGAEPASRTPPSATASRSSAMLRRRRHASRHGLKPSQVRCEANFGQSRLSVRRLRDALGQSHVRGSRPAVPMEMPRSRPKDWFGSRTRLDRWPASPGLRCRTSVATGPGHGPKTRRRTSAPTSSAPPQHRPWSHPRWSR